MKAIKFSSPANFVQPDQFEPDFDVIVVGAGVAGSIAALQIAKAGHSVALIERGQIPGEKNLSGGVFYSRIMEEIFPNFLQEAPLERKITRNVISFLNPNSHVNIDYWDTRFGKPVNAVSVLRAKLDAWLAEQAEEAGVMLMQGVRVDQLLHTASGQVCGIIAGDEELTAHIVIAADGVNSFLAQEAGIRPKQPPKNLAVGVKSVYQLSAEKITERFNLGRANAPTHDLAPNNLPQAQRKSEDAADNLSDGAAFAVVGDATCGIAGGGFLYTNKHTISIGVVLRLDDLQAKEKSAIEIHDHFLQHPAIAPYLRDAKPIEYGCHLTIENGSAMAAQEISAPGLLIIGDAAGFTINNGFTIRGMDLTAQSAICAATAAGKALIKGDFSASAMAEYRNEINNSWLGADLDYARRIPEFLENSRIFNDYGQILANILYGIYNIDLQARQPIIKIARKALRDAKIKLSTLARDCLKAIRAF